MPFIFSYLELAKINIPINILRLLQLNKKDVKAFE